MGNNRSIITVIIGNNDLVIIDNNDMITYIIMSNNVDITVITGNNVIIRGYNECNNDGLISNNDGNNEEKQVIMM